MLRGTSATSAMEIIADAKELKKTYSHPELSSVTRKIGVEQCWSCPFGRGDGARGGRPSRGAPLRNSRGSVLFNLLDSLLDDVRSSPYTASNIMIHEYILFGSSKGLFPVFRGFSEWATVGKDLHFWPKLRCKPRSLAR